MRATQNFFNDESTRLREDDLFCLIRAVTDINECSVKASEILLNAAGSPIVADHRIRGIYETLKIIGDHPLWQGECVSKTLGPSGSLSRYGYALIRGSEYPVARTMLVRGHYSASERVFVIIEILAGEYVLRRFSPATRLLGADGDGNRYVDSWCTTRYNGGSWVDFLVRDQFVDIVAGLDQLLQRIGGCHAARLANVLSYRDILTVYSHLLFAELLAEPRKNSGRFSRPSIRREALRLAFGDEIPASLLNLEAISPEVRDEVTAWVWNRITNPINAALEAVVQSGGLLPQRSLMSYLGAFESAPALVPESFYPVMEKATIAACDLLPKIQRAILKRTKRRQKSPVHVSDIPPLHVSDLESRDRVRQCLAVTNEIMPNFESFLTGSGIEHKYLDCNKETPNCPMPVEGCEPIDLRLKAAVFLLLLDDLKDVTLPFPAQAFQYNPSPGMNEERAKACKLMVDQLGSTLRYYLACRQVMGKAERLNGMAEAWLSMIEGRVRVAGGGIDSQTDFIVPVLFFSDALVQHLLRNEPDNVRQSWLSVRATASLIADAMMKCDLVAANRHIRELMSLMEAFWLAVIENGSGAGTGCANPFAIPRGNVFAPPNNFLSENIHILAEAAAPIQVVTAPPGRPEKYAELVRHVQPFINRLRQLESLPCEEEAALTGYSRNGPVIDPNRLHLFPLGHLMFSTVLYQKEPLPGVRRIVSILVDFSGSMNEARVNTAKNAAIVLAEGLSGFDIELWAYNTAGALYRMTQIFRSADRKLNGPAALSAITHRDMKSGSGWNPDAAVLLMTKELFDRNPASEQAVLIHLGDHEYCGSLAGRSYPTATSEVGYAVRKLSEKYHYIAARVGTDGDPLPADVPHSYIHFPDAPLSHQKVEELYGILKTITIQQEAML